MMPFASSFLTNADFYSAKLIATQVVQGGSFTSSTPASLGAVVGDLAVMATPGNATVSSGSGAPWSTATVGGAGAAVSWRQLSAADLSSGISPAPYGGALSIYRGASSLVQVVTGSATGAAHVATAAGFTRSTAHAGLYAATRSIGGGYALVGISAPATFANPGGSITYDYNGPQNNFAAYDRLSPPNGRYEGESFTFTWAGSAGTYYLSVFELRI